MWNTILYIYIYLFNIYVIYIYVLCAYNISYLISRLCGNFKGIVGCCHKPPCYEVQIGEEVPAVVSPMKPKFYLLGDLTVDAMSAVKLKWVLICPGISINGQFWFWEWVQVTKCLGIHEIHDGRLERWPMCVQSKSGQIVATKESKLGQMCCHKKNHIFHFTLCCPERDGLLTAFDAPMRPWENLAAWNDWKNAVICCSSSCSAKSLSQTLFSQHTLT